MPQAINESTDFETGVVTQTIIPWTAETLRAVIADLRYQKETGGITVGDQAISTERDEIGHWFPRYYNAKEWIAGDAATIAGNPDGQYPYKPKEGEPVILTAAQVMRAYDCISWYINQCFGTEKLLVAQIEAGADLDTVAASLDSVWPQTAFDWTPPA